MKNVMTIAWEIAKKGAAKFGGAVKSYFAQALKMAWAQIKEVSVKSQIVLAGKKGDSLFVAIPTAVEVTVTNVFNTVRDSVGVITKNGVDYNLFTIIVDARYTKFAEFNTIVNGKFESHKADLVNRKLA